MMKKTGAAKSRKDPGYLGGTIHRKSKDPKIRVSPKQPEKKRKKKGWKGKGTPFRPNYCIVE